MYIVVEQEQASFRFPVRVNELVFLQEGCAVRGMFGSNLREQHANEHRSPSVARMRRNRLVQLRVARNFLGLRHE